MPEGTLRAILKQAGVESEVFLQKKPWVFQNALGVPHPCQFKAAMREDSLAGWRQTPVHEQPFAAAQP